MGCYALLQGIFPTQGSNPGLLHCRWILYHLSHQGIPYKSYIYTILQSIRCAMRRQWQPIPVLLPGNSHGWRSLVGCSPWCREESDMTERHHFLFSLSCTGAENGNPLQCSCLEKSRDGGAWWAAIYGVAQSWTRLKQLSSSSSMGLRDLSSQIRD